MLPRFYLLRESALEVFWASGKNNFFNFISSQEHKLEDRKPAPTGLCW